MEKNLIKIFILIFFVEFSSACQGNKLKINYIKNCGKDNIIKIDSNATAKLTKDCEIIPTACAETQGFQKAMIHYEIFKNNLPVLRGDVDGCEELEKLKPELKGMIKIFGLPEKCPVTATSKCEDGSKKANIDAYKSFLTLARGGPIRTEIMIQHENGKSCFKSEMEIVKKM